jgi:membrane protease YdiL (CAAX protease family)
MEHGDMSFAASADAPFRLKPLPMLIAVLLGLGIVALSAITIDIAEHFVGLIERPEMRWISDGYVELAQLFYAYIAILWMRRLYPGDYGLKWPEGKSYVLQAVLWGVLFGVVATLSDYAPLLIAHRPPSQPYGLTPINITGWVTFDGLIASSSDEMLLRGLIVTYLTVAMPGRVSFRGYEMNGAGVVVAALYALAHVGNFFFAPFGVALAQVVYLFVQGVLLAYWFEKSGSLLAPIVSRGVTNVIERACLFAMVAAWASPHLF